jgi:hypothetical protein
MLNNVIRFFFPKSNKPLLFEKILEIKEFRKKTNHLVIYGSPTEGNWLGIANATKSLFPDYAYSFPQWYSHPVFNVPELTIWKSELIKLKFETITLSGFAPFFFDLLEEFGDKQHFEVIYHGTWSEMHKNDQQNWMNRLLELSYARKIQRIGFVKKGMAETIHQLYGFDCFHTPLPTPIVPKIEKLSLDKDKIHIGVFGADTFNKNLHNQVIHALLIENAVIHVLDKSIFSYLNMDERIIEHGKNLTRERFLQVLGSMDLNLYMSYSESWGLVAYESEALEVPCVHSFQVNYLEIINEQVKNIRK